MKVTDKDYYMDGYLKKNLDTAKSVIKKDWDMVFVYDGSEGSGKSVKAMQDAYYCDNTFNLDRVVFTPYAFRKAITESEPYMSIVYDEAYTGLSSRATMSLINRTLISMLAEIRQKNLFIFVVMPTFFDLDKYVALWRSRALIHIYTGDNFQRGFFTFYNIDRKKDLYIKGKKYYNYRLVKPNFYGRFTNFYVVDAVSYRKKKKDALLDREKKKEEEEKRRMIQDEMFARYMDMDKVLRDKIPVHVIAELLGMTRQSVWRKVKLYEETPELIG